MNNLSSKMFKQTMTRLKLSSYSSPLLKKSPGLFSIAGLLKPSDFLSLASEAMETCNGIRRSIEKRSFIRTSEEASETLRDLDAISNEICCVIDASELCRNSHPKEVWRDKAEVAFGMLSEYIAGLNSDRGLYEILRNITSSNLFLTLNEAEQRFGRLLQNEFEREGIHLSSEERNELAHLHLHISNLETTFSQNIIKFKDSISLPSKETLYVLPENMVEKSPKRGHVLVSSDANIMNTLIKYSPSASIRKEVYIHTNTACENNLDVLDELIRNRNLLGKKLGFRSYSHYFLKDKMAQNPENVLKFLHQILKNVQKKIPNEILSIQNMKKQLEGNDEIHPWDVSFYTTMIKSQMFELDQDFLRSYFTLSNCLEAMTLLVNNLFGIEMVEVKPCTQEIWCDSIRKFHFNHDSLGFIGTLYFDLFPRENKYVHAAHFTVRCGCRSLNGFQTPIVALVCNVSPPSPHHNSSTSFLSHTEVETLFHEFGHALHSLLSRTDFQHLSGTRAPIDFVETPSHIFENYVWCAPFLKILAKHYQTGQPLDESIITDKLIPSRHAFQYLELQSQVIYSIFDQLIFGPPQDKSTSEIFAQLHHENNIPFVDGTHWHSRFGHLVTYGAGYYGYLYAKTLSADIWNSSFASNPLNKSVGEKFWTDILIHGGARDPNKMLKLFLGRQPSIQF